MKKLTFLLALFAFISACNKEKSDAEIAAEDDVAIQAYLKKNNLTAQKTTEGIYYIIEKEGTGNFVTLSNTVTANYKGYYVDDKIFDQSAAPAKFPMTGVIVGWQIGLQKFKKGGKGKLFIPSFYGYGKRGYLGVPANAVLIFDVEVVDLL